MLVINRLEELNWGIDYEYLVKIVDINSPMIKYLNLRNAIKVFKNSRARLLKINVVFKEESLVIIEIVSLLPNSVLTRIFALED